MKNPQPYFASHEHKSLSVNKSPWREMKMETESQQKVNYETLQSFGRLSDVG